MDTDVSEILVAIAAALGGIGLFALIFFLVSRSIKQQGARIASFIAAKGPGRVLAEASLRPGEPLELGGERADGANVWLDCIVEPSDGRSEWSGDVEMIVSHGVAREESRFKVGYDGDEHWASPHAKSIIAIPAGNPLGVSRIPPGPGSRVTLNLGPLPTAVVAPDVGGFRGVGPARFHVQCRLALTTPARTASFRLYVTLPGSTERAGP